MEFIRKLCEYLTKPNMPSAEIRDFVRRECNDVNFLETTLSKKYMELKDILSIHEKNNVEKLVKDLEAVVASKKRNIGAYELVYPGMIDKVMQTSSRLIKQKWLKTD